MNRHYAQVAERAGQRCEYCRAPEAIFNLPFEVEHIVPTSRDGADDESNLALACRAWNLYKSNQQNGADETTREVVRLFHPRHDRWDEHFRVASEGGEIQGLTPIGRVTVACPRMNRDASREARRAWMRFKLYP
jgi:hypothetical protein